MGPHKRGTRLTSEVLPPAGAADQGDGLAGADVEIDVVERGALAIAQGDVLETDGAAQTRLDATLVGLGLDIDQREIERPPPDPAAGIH